ncbi:hypothetical protein [Rufibacter psychrotolerans]|uniref:hypothetical protein n=1 Tax=Rufibacter psychrotolerans TaxID=2812556 RepID=UPI0019673C75|nr:hypothetical protein [Rufibacter sp. SYSU D00308]
MKARLANQDWTQVAGVLLLAGAMAWALKLAVIISTDGRVITTGAAAFLMKVGLVLLAVGSTGIGHRVSLQRAVVVRVLALLLSPAVGFGLFLLFAKVATPILVNPLLAGHDIWYAQQEAPIALAVLFYLTLGLLLLKSCPAIRR